MTTETKTKTTQVHSGTTAGAFWFAGWMFTIAFAKLIWWKILLGLIVWPWYLALAVR